MDLTNSVFQNYLESYIIVFVDDILIYSKNKNVHESDLRVSLQVLKKH